MIVHNLYDVGEKEKNIHDVNERMKQCNWRMCVIGINAPQWCAWQFEFFFNNNHPLLYVWQIQDAANHLQEALQIVSFREQDYKFKSAQEVLTVSWGGMAWEVHSESESVMLLLSHLPYQSKKFTLCILIKFYCSYLPNQPSFFVCDHGLFSRSQGCWQGKTKKTSIFLVMYSREISDAFPGQCKTLTLSFSQTLFY